MLKFIFSLMVALNVSVSNANAMSANGRASELFTFEVAEPQGTVSPHVTLKIRVILKSDFSGTAKFYSCDRAKFMLVDIPNAEFVENISYDINAKKGPIAKFDAVFYSVAEGTTPLVCAEYSGGAALKEKRLSAQLTNKIIYRPDNTEDWYSSNILEAIALNDSFAEARTTKLLLNYYPPEMAVKVIPGLVDWIKTGSHTEKAEKYLRMLLKQFGGKEVAAEAIQLLGSENTEERKNGIRLLNLCGSDADTAATQVTALLLSEKDGEVHRDALLLAKNRGYEIPPRFNSLDEISTDAASAHKRKIKDACDFAASIDLTQKEAFLRDYDDNGVRIPPPANAKKAIADLEKLISEMPNYPEMARAYLLLGRLKQRYENSYYAPYDSETNQQRVPPEIQNKESEYDFFEIDPHYFYNGYHFTQLITLFPNSEYVDDAAFEKTGTSVGGECESDENCPFEREASPYLEFLKAYPSSNLAGTAIDTVNNAFESVTKSKEERLSATKHFSVDAFKRLVNDYQEAVAAVALPEKSKAYDTICILWEKTGETEKAAQACNFILKDYPSYPTISKIKTRAQKLKTVGFELKPPLAVGYRLVSLEWEPVKDAISYTIYRATANSEAFTKLQLLSGATSFQDTTIAPSTSYTYYIDALTPDGTKSTSNNASADIPGTDSGASIAFFNEEERAFYIFGHIYNSQRESFPEVVRISEDGKVITRFSGRFYGHFGYFESPLDKYADNTLLVDPIHQKFLRFPKDIDFEKSIKVIRAQNMGINPYPQGKWWPREGRYLVSLSQDNRSAWITNVAGGTWPSHDFLAWDSVNGLCWEGRGRMVIQYSSQDPSQAIPITPGEGIYFYTGYPDEKEGAIWAVGALGDFYKINRTGQVVTHFKTDPVSMGSQVAFNTAKNYAWVLKVNYDDPTKTRLRKLSLKDGTTITEATPTEYVSPGEHHGNHSMHISLDRQTENLWILNAGDHRLIKLSSEGKNIQSLKI